MKNLIKRIIHEMAKPSDWMGEMYWYHGTTESNARKIKEGGMILPAKPSNAYMAPMKGHVYLGTLDEALGYAKFRSKGFDMPCVVVIRGKSLEDIYPDEDIIADLLSAMRYDFKLKYFFVDDKDFKFNEILNLINNHSKFKNLAFKYAVDGFYHYGTKLGKMLIPHLSKDTIYDLIEHGMKLSNKGGIPIEEIYAVPLEYVETVNSDNFFEYALPLK